MKNKNRKFIIVLISVLLLPLWMWLAWVLSSKKKLVVIIVDKTVEMTNGSQHASFTWVLNNQRFTKNTSSLYSINNDYFGFFPLQNEKFRLKGLERFSPELLEKLSNDADMVYFTDTYGVYKNDWYKKNAEPGIIYGGMSEQDIELLKKMKAKHKLIISEFNTIGSPTSDKVRGDFENLFGLKWSGWVGRYFSSLDTTGNAGLPSWIVNNYKSGYGGGQWPFHAAGIVFVNTNGKVVILEKENQLSEALPFIHVNADAQKKYNLPQQIAYPFWFDVMEFDSSLNQAIAKFEVKTNEAGMQLLKQNNIPSCFPAILTHKKDYQFYYFSGNFCDNPVSMKTSYFKGISVFESLFYHSEKVTDRKQFFWKFYRPLITVITNDYYGSLRKTNADKISDK
jgi:hypothetical protein